MAVRFRIEDPALAGPLRQIEQLIRRAGGRTWLVGGCIRDLVLGGNRAIWTSKFPGCRLASSMRCSQNTSPYSSWEGL